MKRIQKFLSLVVLTAAMLCFSTVSYQAAALTSYCLKYPGTTLTHEVLWTSYETMTFIQTMMQSHAWGPNAPGGVTAYTAHTTTESQPLVHALYNWAPGQWGILGDSNQFALIESGGTMEVITNPNPGACAEDYALP